MSRYMTALLPWMLLAGCAISDPPKSELSPLQARAVNSRDLGKQFGATYDEIWWATMTTLQDAGFVVRQASKNDGYIYGVWLNSFEKESDYFGPLNAAAMRSFSQVEVSVTLEKSGEHSTLVRLSTRLGPESEAQDDAAFTRRFFAYLQKEVFLREAQKRLVAAKT
jgi:hypothetical protein